MSWSLFHSALFPGLYILLCVLVSIPFHYHVSWYLYSTPLQCVLVSIPFHCGVLGLYSIPLLCVGPYSIPLSLPPDHGRGNTEDPSSDALEGRKEAFSYLLTLFRGTGEGGGVLPAIDVAGKEHLAWTLDALHYLLEVGREGGRELGGERGGRESVS